MHTLQHGIRPEEGADAFNRALGAGQSQIVVSSLDLDALIAGTRAATDRSEEGQSFERPDLDSEYVEPRNDVERTLVGFWQDLLGVAKVGVEDSFFDLGGHSLIAVRLFAMVKKTFRVDFPISVLFEAPTISACAALIIEQIGLPSEAEPAAPVRKNAAPQRRFTHLVPMHRGEGGQKAPFFLVAGMFGNVLNLRHLAQLLGGDRPFYGLQARGLYGDADPHTSFDAAARDYIAEMKQVHPNGPWLLGGFSGGGLIAWEIARQLEAEGQEVQLLVLLDTPLPIRPSLSKLDKLLIRLAEFRDEGPAFLTRWWQDKQAYKARLRNVALAGSTDFHNAEIEAAFRGALPSYQMVPRAGKTVLYRPPMDRRWQVTGGRWVTTAREFVFPDNDLTQFAPNLEVVEVPGDHDSMVLEPNVRVLAARMRAAIVQASERGPIWHDSAAVAEPEVPNRLATAAE